MWVAAYVAVEGSEAYIEWYRSALRLPVERALRRDPRFNDRVYGLVGVWHRVNMLTAEPGYFSVVGWRIGLRRGVSEVRERVIGSGGPRTASRVGAMHVRVSRHLHDVNVTFAIVANMPMGVLTDTASGRGRS